MTEFGTPFKSNSKKALILGSGELGKEVVIELLSTLGIIRKAAAEQAVAKL